MAVFCPCCRTEKADLFRIEDKEVWVGYFTMQWFCAPNPGHLYTLYCNYAAERWKDTWSHAANQHTHPRSLARKIGTLNPAQLLEPDQKCLYPMLNANNLRTVLHSSGRKKKKKAFIYLILLHLWKKLKLGTHYAKKLFIRTAPRQSRFLTWFPKNPVLFSFAFSLLSARAVNYLMSWLGCI